MKLRKFTVKEFKSIWGSGPIEVDDSVTCLVGKNESGKTALLTALYRTNPIIPEDGCFNLTYDYPKREVEDYRFAVEKGDRQEAVVVDCVYELEAEDKAVVADTFGENTLKNNELRQLTYYVKRPSDFQLVVNDQAAREHLASNSGFPTLLQDSLKAASNWEDFAILLGDSEPNDAVEACKEVVGKITEHGLARYIVDSLLWPRASKFLYFDEYYQMTGRNNPGLRKSLVFADSRKIYSADSGTGASIAAVIGADRRGSDESLRKFSGELPAEGAAILRAGTAAQRALLPTRPGALQGLYNGVDRVLRSGRVVAIGRGMS